MTWVNLESIMASEISRKTNTLGFYLFVKSKATTTTTEVIDNREQVVDFEWWGAKWMEGVKRCKPPVTK